ncbi:HD domain-containing protein, partial [Escherichia coli]|uniref:HD domain-containing protein n=1 Tax=Escherichia coli TaxID=562 RepID=UPI000DEE5F96
WGEMGDVLSTLRVEFCARRAAWLFHRADATVVIEGVVREGGGNTVVNLILGVRFMAASRLLKATHTGSVSSGQVDNVRLMFVAIVDDFRCVVIKLSERI